MRFTRVVLALALVHSTGALAQTVPGTVTFTARLADNGVPATGSKSFLFKIFPTVAGGTEAWMETQSLMVTDGNVTAELGASTPLTETIFGGAQMYLDVTVDGTVLSPRTVVVSVPYALRTNVAAKVGTFGEVDIQKRVSTNCPAGSSIRAIDAMGNVTCQAATVTQGTDGGPTGITGVFGGAGLTGGGAVGDVNLAVDFGTSSGSASTAARSDHNHTGTYLPLATTSLACGGTDKISSINPGTGAITCTPDLAGSGTVTSVGTGSGLIGGPITTAGTISLASTVQNWVTQPGCAAGSFVRSIALDGTVTCGTDANSGGTLTTVATIAPINTTGGNTPVLSLNTCPAAQFLRMNLAGTAWTCSINPDTDTGVDTLINGVGIVGGITGVNSRNLTLGLASTVQNWTAGQAACANRAIQSISADGTPVCISVSNGTVTSVTAGTGLVSVPTGGITSTGSLSLAATVQNWTVGQPNCAVGQTVKAIAADGTPTCVPTVPSPKGQLAYAWVSNCSTGTCTIFGGYGYNSTGGAISVARSAPGAYTINFLGLTGSTGTGFGHPQITAYGNNNTYCKLNFWSGGQIGVSCYAAGGTQVDSDYNVMIIY